MMPDGRRLNLSKTELLAHLASLPLNERAQIIRMARTIRAAREAGDPRPAAQIVAGMVQPGRRVVLH